MKRFLIIFSLLLAYYVVAYSAPQFNTEPQDSIIFSFDQLSYPASIISISDVRKIGDDYYFLFYDLSRLYPRGRYHLMAASAKDLQAKYIPLPGNPDIDLKQVKYTPLESLPEYTLSVDDKSYLTVQTKDKSYRFKNNQWKRRPVKTADNVLYEDKEWVVKSRFLFEDEWGATWFINKKNRKEYAFVELNGSVHRINGVFYVVTRTRVYEISDPELGFQCKPAERYKKNKRDIDKSFYNSGYYPPHHFISPIIKYDDLCSDSHLFLEPPLINYKYHVRNEYYVPSYPKTDSEIVGSYVSSGYLYCMLNTPDGLCLTKLEGNRLDTIQRYGKYDKVLFSRHSQNSSYPSEESLMLLAHKEQGQYSLLEFCGETNSCLRLQYNHGLKDLSQDGFEELLTYCLDNWDHLTFDYVLSKETALGGKVSLLNFKYKSDMIPRSEPYHVDIITKQINNTYELHTSYWIHEPDSSIYAIGFEWTPISWSRKSSQETMDIITKILDEGTYHPGENNKMTYMKWQYGPRTVIFYMKADRVYIY